MGDGGRRQAEALELLELALGRALVGNSRSDILLEEQQAGRAQGGVLAELKSGGLGAAELTRAFGFFLGVFWGLPVGTRSLTLCIFPQGESGSPGENGSPGPMVSMTIPPLLRHLGSPADGAENKHHRSLCAK